jgi:hypothetical protein
LPLIPTDGSDAVVVVVVVVVAVVVDVPGDVVAANLGAADAGDVAINTAGSALSAAASATPTAMRAQAGAIRTLITAAPPP